MNKIEPTFPAARTRLEEADPRLSLATSSREVVIGETARHKGAFAGRL